MLKTICLSRSRWRLFGNRQSAIADHQSVDTCGGSWALRPCLMSDDARLARAHQARGVAAPPMRDTRCWTRRTKASGFAERHALQHLWAGRQLPGSSGEPPLDTGTTSSTTPWTGERLCCEGSMGRPQIQHGSPLPSTRRLSISRRWPFDRRGFDACGMYGPLMIAAPPGARHPLRCAGMPAP